MPSELFNNSKKLNDWIHTSPTSSPLFNIETISITDLMDKAKQKVKEMKDDVVSSIKNGIDKLKETTSLVAMIPILIADSSVLNNAIDHIRRISNQHFNADFSTDEWKCVYDNAMKIGLSMDSIADEVSRLRIAKKAKRIELLASREAKLRKEKEISDIKEINQLCQYACLRLTEPISSFISEKNFDFMVSNIEHNFGDELIEICKSVRMEIGYSKELSHIRYKIRKEARRDDCPASADPSDDDSTDDVLLNYLDIVRFYIVLIDESLLTILLKLSSIQNGTEWLIKRVHDLKADEVDNQLVADNQLVDSSDFGDIPIGTMTMALLWIVMLYELFEASNEDSNVNLTKKILATANAFAVILLTILSREGLPKTFDRGVTSIVAKAQKHGYAALHDIVRPVIDCGVSFVNHTLEKANINCVIVRNPSWHERLENNINHHEPLLQQRLKMDTALNMLHMFRVADGMLSSLLYGKNILDEGFKKTLMRLSPIPLAGEEKKVIMLFWLNPYAQNIEGYTSLPLYSVSSSKFIPSDI